MHYLCGYKSILTAPVDRYPGQGSISVSHDGGLLLVIDVVRGPLDHDRSAGGAVVPRWLAEAAPATRRGTKVLKASDSHP